jgi:hypothetical protein
MKLGTGNRGQSEMDVTVPASQFAAWTHVAVVADCSSSSGEVTWTILLNGETVRQASVSAHTSMDASSYQNCGAEWLFGSGVKQFCGSTVGVKLADVRLWGCARAEDDIRAAMHSPVADGVLRAVRRVAEACIPDGELRQTVVPPETVAPPPAGNADDVAKLVASFRLNDAPYVIVRNGVPGKNVCGTLAGYHWVPGRAPCASILPELQQTGEDEEEDAGNPAQQLLPWQLDMSSWQSSRMVVDGSALIILSPTRLDVQGYSFAQPAVMITTVSLESGTLQYQRFSFQNRVEMGSASAMSGQPRAEQTWWSIGLKTGELTYTVSKFTLHSAVNPPSWLRSDTGSSTRNQPVGGSRAIIAATSPQRQLVLELTQTKQAPAEAQSSPDPFRDAEQVLSPDYVPPEYTGEPALTGMACYP